ncbi:MAG: plasmid pRiA4b ORF-3 family protein [Actinomycetota bacterium]
MSASDNVIPFPPGGRDGVRRRREAAAAAHPAMRGPSEAEKGRHCPPGEHPPREVAALYGVRVDIIGAKPPIWRRIDLPSDLTLDRLHVVIQAAMGWEDRHAHRFQTARFRDPSASPFRTADDPDDVAAPAEADVRLDEVLARPGDRLYYLYDPGDDWQHVIMLETALPPIFGYPEILCGGGRRRCPPEEAGGIRAYNEAVAVLDGKVPASDAAPELLEMIGSWHDPARFDKPEANRRIRQRLEP